LRSQAELEAAATTLAEAFVNDPEFQSWVGMPFLQAKVFKTMISPMSELGLVLGANGTQAVLAAVPNYTDEVAVFTSNEALQAYGFRDIFMQVGLPPDAMHYHGQLKVKHVSGPYIYIAFFGACNKVRGEGIAKQLLKHILAFADEQRLQTVLETATESNRVNYEKYGFRVVAHVDGYPEYVLMVRPSVGDCLERGSKSSH